jgi:formamidopyrimidine-DNA glycosylase
MPELPEVETIKRSLRPNKGARITRIEIIRPDIIKKAEYDPEIAEGMVIADFNRRGKYLIIRLEESYFILVHMGMSGRFYTMGESEQDYEKHVHFIVHLNNNQKLVFQDARRFGGIWFICDLSSFFCNMGKEPLNHDFSASYLHSELKNRRAAIKTLLLNQDIVCGIGNIYADEALYLAGIRPDRSADSLSEEEFLRLNRAIKMVLQQGIEKRGTTFRDYRDGNNAKGGFQDHLQVYGRAGEKCNRCGAEIIRERIGGRSSHYCQHCQK